MPDNINKIINFFLPGNCYLCHALLENNEKCLCQTCAGKFKPLVNTCKLCASPLWDNASVICGNCINHPPVWQQAIVPFAYSGATGFLLKELKFNRGLGISSQLSRLFLKALKTRTSKLPDMIIPVPLHRAKLARRGFNQTYELSNIIGKELKIPIATNICYRAKNTISQTGLNHDERRKNLSKAFVLERPELIRNKHIVLFDDVYTTGATLNALAKICRIAKRIDVWCIAKTT